MKAKFIFTFIATWVLSLFGSVSAQEQESTIFLLPEGGCHTFEDIDEVTGERIVLTGRQAEAASSQHRAHYASTSDGLGSYNKSGVGVLSTIGDVTIPVILVDFSDQGFLPSSTVEEYDRWFNEEGYSTDGHNGSVRDFFIAQSNGMFRPTFHVFGIAHTDENYATYGAGGINAENTGQLLKDVAGKYSYSGMTTNLCIIVYAGQGEHRGAGEDRIWAKFSEFGFFDFQKFSSCLFINEAITSTSREGIGTACHEICHALGLPDVYTTGTSGCVSPGNWDLMATGNYVNNSRTPQALCALERSQCGWLQMTELTNARAGVKLAPGEAAFTRSSGSNSEYYIFENRTNNPWTPSTMDGGMLVYHVDYNRSAWENTQVNYDASHPRMMFVYANNANGAAYDVDYHNALYPSAAKNDRLDPSSTPAMTAYNGNFNGKGIYNVRRDGVFITFDFGNATSAVPPIYSSINEKGVPAAKYNFFREVGPQPVSLGDIDENKTYALYNPHFTTYAIYNPSTSNGQQYLWAAGMTGDADHQVSYSALSQPYNPSSNYNIWRVKKVADGQYYFMNEGSGLYLSTPFRNANRPCEWSPNPSILYTGSRTDGLFTLSTSGAASDWACVAPQNGDKAIVNYLSTDDGSGWQLFPIIEGSDSYEATASRFPINVDYNASGTNTSGRSLSYVGLQVSGGEAQRVEAKSPLRTYQDLTDKAFEVPAGSILRPTIGYNGSSMHGYFYIDYNQDGELSIPASHSDRTKDLCAFNFWSDGNANGRGYNSSGIYVRATDTYITNGVMSMPSAIAPEKPGTYYIRYKVDWDNIDPAGSGSLTADNGFIVDVKLIVTGDAPTVDPETPTPTEGVRFPINFAADATGTHSDINRKLNYIAVKTKDGAVQRQNALSEWRTYQNMSESAAFIVKAGATFVPSIGYGGTWMHGFFYMDLNADGTLYANASTGAQGNELLSYTFYNSTSDSFGYNSLGTMTTNGNSVVNGVITMPEVTAPDTPGRYYARFKVDWNNIDPAGNDSESNHIVKNSGFIVDIAFDVTDEDGEIVGPVDPIDPVEPVDPVDPDDGGDYFTPDPDSPSVFPISINPGEVGTTAGRTLSYVALTVEGGEQQKLAITPASTTIYHDYRDVRFTVNPGDKFTPEIGFNGSWMHGYLYIDLDRNGELSYNADAVSQEGTDCVSYSFWSGNTNSDTAGYDSAGSRLTGDARSTVVDGCRIPLPVVTAPSEPGVYYMRYKVDWNDVNPAGSIVTNNTIKKNSGFIIDLALRVADPLDLNADGRVTIVDLAQAVSILLTPGDTANGVTLETVEAISRRILKK